MQTCVRYVPKMRFVKGIDDGGMQSVRVEDRVAFSLFDGPEGPRAANVWVP